MRPTIGEEGDAFRFLCDLVASDIRGETPSACMQAIDPAALVSLARRHRVLGLLSRLPQPPATLPAAIMSQTRAGLRQAAALVAIITAAQARGLALMVLKGLPLSVQLHGDPFRRGGVDIDLLVSPACFMAAADLLMELGYVPDPDGPPLAAMTDGSQHIRDLTFIGHGQRIELHRRLYELSTRLPSDFDILWRDRAEVTLGPARVATLGEQHLALYLLVHGYGHDWERLRWLLDLALLLTRPGAMEMVEAQARQFRVERARTQALALINHFFGPLPGFPAIDAVPVRPLRRMAQYGTGVEPMAKSVAWFGFRLGQKWRDYRLHDGVGDFLMALARDLAANADDMTLFKLPSGLVWLYPLLRPIGFLWRNVLPALRSVKQ